MNSRREMFFSEIERLRSFQDRKWPLPFLGPDELAKCGFFYLGVSDRVQCPFCGIVIFGWQNGDLPIMEHKIHSGKCPFINGRDVGNVFIDMDPRELYHLTQGEDVCGFAHQSTTTDRVVVKAPEDQIKGPGFKYSAPRSMEFITYDKRLSSFKDWPASSMIAPARLAESGFYYQGPAIDATGCQYDDYVICFHCGISLCQWAKDDDPWKEHEKFSPTCPFVMLLSKQNEFEKESEASQTSSNATAEDSTAHASASSSNSSDVSLSVEVSAADNTSSEASFRAPSESSTSETLNQDSTTPPPSENKTSSPEKSPSLASSPEPSPSVASSSQISSSVSPSAETSSSVASSVDTSSSLPSTSQESSQEACPSGVPLPEASLPEASLPEVSFPEASSSEASLPEGSSSESSLPEASPTAISSSETTNSEASSPSTSTIEASPPQDPSFSSETQSSQDIPPETSTSEVPPPEVSPKTPTPELPSKLTPPEVTTEILTPEVLKSEISSTENYPEKPSIYTCTQITSTPITSSKSFIPYLWLPKPEIDDFRCKICFDYQVGVTFHPCLHTACPPCAAALANCPICRTPISRVIKLKNAIDQQKKDNKINFYI